MWARVLLVLALTGCMARVPIGPQAGPAEVSWAGTMRCDNLPQHSTVALVQPVTLVVRDGVASLTRDVRVAGTAIASGYQERSGGTVGADGRVRLTGQGSAAGGSSYSAEYGGVLPPDGSAAELTGHQMWQFGRGAALDRMCRLSLRRAG